MNRRKLKARLWRWSWISAVLVVLFTVLCNRWVINSTDAYVYKNWALLPENDVGLVLGTSPYTRGGKPNPHFYARINAAVELYQIGKIKHIIVSGANPDSTYNEPRQMWRELTKAGIPSNVITMDFAGLRTLDSISRAQAVFGLTKMTIITQEYHAYRAVFIGKKLGMKVAAYSAPGTDSGPEARAFVREMLARVKVVLDIFVLETRPKFLGQPEPIEVPAEAQPTP